MRAAHAIAAMSLIGALTVPAPAGAAQVFTVDTTDDLTTACVPGGCSLRAAVAAANADAARDTIAFAIPGDGPHVIGLNGPNLVLTQPAVIDATTEPGYAGAPLIEIRDVTTSLTAYGLQVMGGSSEIRGLAFTEWGTALFLGGQNGGPGGNVVDRNYFGLEPDGTTVRTNNFTDIRVQGSSNNVIGGGSFAHGNVLAGPRDNQFWCCGDGTIYGVEIHQGSPVTVGPLVPAENNRVIGNLIGTDASGAVQHGHRGAAVLISAPNNVVGEPGSGNVLSGATYGLFSDSTNMTVQGNLIGTNASGTAALGNLDSGIRLEQGNAPRASENHLIGGSAIGAGNVISGNGNGVLLQAYARSNTIKGNKIGTDITGEVALPNNNGIQMSGATNNVIGGPNPADRNVISGNRNAGIQVFQGGAGGQQVPAVGNIVEGNIVGLTPSDEPLGNGPLPSSVAPGRLPNGAGVAIQGSTNLVRANVISANSGFGLSLNGTNNTASGNLIGTDAAGSQPLGNATTGIRVDGTNNTVGGENPADGNVIAVNGRAGVSVDSGTQNVIAYNTIGVGPAGEVWGNGASGVDILWGSGFTQVVDNTIAYNGDAVDPGDKDNNEWGNDGVFVDMGHGNTIRGNSIYANADLGIDLGEFPVDPDWFAYSGVTPNDAGDVDNSSDGANALQNFPVLDPWTDGASESTVTGELNSEPNSQYDLEFFVQPGCDTSGHGEGKVPVAVSQVTTDSAGHADFTVSLQGFAAHTDAVTATATGGGNTSEFSACSLFDDGGGGGDPDVVTEEVPPGGGSVTTDPNNEGATEETPVQATVTRPDGGTVTIERVDEATGPAPSGYSFLGDAPAVKINTPPATAADPLVFTFIVDSTALGGIAPADLQIFRNAAWVPDCTDAQQTIADPDPCVASRGDDNGDAVIIVYTSAASEWAFGDRTDETAPAINIATPADGAAYNVNSTVVADFTCGDAGGSGVTSCTGTVDDGDPIDTATVGAKSFTVSATDAANNESSETVDYSVVYPFAGLFAPMANMPVTNVIKAGTTVPVRFSLGGDRGMTIFESSYPRTRQGSCRPGGTNTVKESLPKTAPTLTYDATSGRYTYALATEKSWAGTCRDLLLRLVDGTERAYALKFSK